MRGDGTLRIEVLGPLRVWRADDTDVTPDGELQRRLLALLVLRRGQTVSPDAAIEALWPDQRPRDPPAALQTHVFRLRRALPEGTVQSGGAGYRLDGTGVVIDADELGTAVTDAAALRASDPARAAKLLDAALDTWRGLPYHELSDVDDGRAEAVRLDELRVRALEERAESLLATGAGTHASSDVIPGLESLAAEHPLRERPRALLMAALVADGRHAEALRVFDDFRRLLGDELGIAPSPSLHADHAALLSGELAPRPRQAARLPVAVTSLVGRDELVDQALALCADERLVTMLGPGGVGKTRLLIEVAGRLAIATPDRPIVLCELAAATPDTTVDVAAAALGIDRRPDASPAERVAAVLGDESMVLLLDNCEHVLEPVADLAEAILRRCPNVVVVTTSRERLRIGGEHLLPVPPLPLTDTGGPAVTLFVERAGAARPGYRPEEQELSAIDQVVRRLDGLPLAIELAAARMHTLDVDDIAAGLDRRFRLLASGSRTTARHRSLGAAVTWSYELLDERLRRVFDDLSIFAGPFSVHDAAAIAGADVADAADDLANLVERSLLNRHAGGRFALLETLRAFGRERLAVTERIGDAARRHAEHWIVWAEEARMRLSAPDDSVVLGQVDAALPELRAAMSWLLAEGDVGRAGRLVAVLDDYGFLRLRPDVLAWAHEVTALDAEDRSPVAARVLAVASLAAWMTGDVVATRSQVERARRVSDARGHRLPNIVAQTLGSSALFEGHLDEAAEWYETAERSSGGHGDQMVSVSLQLLAHAYAGDPRAVDVRRRLGDVVGDAENGYAAFAWYAVGEAELSAGDMDAARRSFQRALDLAERTGAMFVTGVAGTSLASIEARLGDATIAAKEYRRLIDHWLRAGMWSTQWTMLRSIARLLERLGSFREAAVLAGAVTSTDAGHRLFGEDAKELTSLGLRLRESLGEDAYAAAVREGSALDGDAAVRYALHSL